MTIIAYAALTLPVLIFFVIKADLGGNKKLFAILKPAITILIIGIALYARIAGNPDNLYFLLIFTGLLFSLAGDIALIRSENPTAFRTGLIAFLITHILYTFGFSMNNSINSFDILPGLILASALILFYRLIYPNLKNMKISVLLYMIIISIMVSRAVSTLDGDFFSDIQATRLLLGAILFYISDVILAWNRFYKPFRLNRINLSFYYCGQFLIVLSLF